ncbi:MAG: hypothetical protein ACXVYY_01055 [Oryzihumus sp.]
MSRWGPTLSDYDGEIDYPGDGKRPFDKGRGNWRSITGGAKLDLPTLGGPGCWCGEPQNHDWPGKADGAPHPRNAR